MAWPLRYKRNDTIKWLWIGKTLGQGSHHHDTRSQSTPAGTQKGRYQRMSGQPGLSMAEPLFPTRTLSRAHIPPTSHPQAWNMSKAQGLFKAVFTLPGGKKAAQSHRLTGGSLIWQSCLKASSKTPQPSLKHRLPWEQSSQYSLPSTWTSLFPQTNPVGLSTQTSLSPKAWDSS